MSDQPRQLSLELIAAPGARPNPLVPAHPVIDRTSGLDRRLSTNDVLRVLGVNRSTLFRWTKAGRFPAKHPSGGWLRSDVEQWLGRKIRFPSEQK